MITLELGKYTYNNVKLNQYDKNFNIYMTLNNYTYKTGDKFKIEWNINDTIVFIQTDYLSFDSTSNVITVNVCREVTLTSGVGYFNVVVYNMNDSSRRATFKNQFMVVSNSIDENAKVSALVYSAKEELDANMEKVDKVLAQLEGALGEGDEIGTLADEISEVKANVEKIQIKMDECVITPEKTSFINCVDETYINMFNKNDSSIQNNNYIANDGRLIDYSGVFMTHKIYCKGGDVIRITDHNITSTNPGLIYSKNGNIAHRVIDHMTRSNGVRTITIPDDDTVSYVILNCHLPDIDVIMCTINEPMPSIYIPYVNNKTYTISKDISLCIDTSDINDEVVTPEKTTFISDTLLNSSNVFNKTDDAIQLDRYLANDGRLIDYSGAFMTHKIYCKGGDVIRITDHNMTSTNPGLIYLKYDICRYQVIDHMTRSNGVRTITIPDDEDVAYVILNGHVDGLDDIMCTINEPLPSTYVPYVNIKTYKLSDKINISPLYGKKIITNGDSIMRGAGNNNVGFIDIISGRNNMTCINYAVGGGTLANNTYNSDGVTPRHWISDSVDNMDGTADYVILDGGFNDYGNNITLGGMTNTYNDNFDKTTIIGALEHVCQTLYNKYPTAKKGFVFPHGLSTITSNWIVNIIPKMKIVLDKWGVDYIDLATCSPPLFRINSMKNIYTKNGDGVHPNELGYKTFYCDAVEKWMENL